MSASALLSELRAAGVTLAATGDRLKIEAAPGIITPELTARLKASKPELLAILAGNAAANDAPEADTEPAQDLPLLAALAEFDALIERLCDVSRYPADVREEMRQARRRMSPDNLRLELPVMREHLARAEAGDRAAVADDRITCRECVNRRPYDGACKIASPGGTVTAVVGYVPDATLAHRCDGFMPKPGATDQRDGAARWRGLLDDG